MRRGIAAGLLLLAGCASNEQWERIGPGLELAQAQAYCDTVSMGAGSGYYAQGSPAFVAGAAVGNAIGNAITQARVYRNCMTLQGWQSVPKPKKPVT
jgi:hypothetical protein